MRKAIPSALVVLWIACVGACYSNNTPPASPSPSPSQAPGAPGPAAAPSESTAPGDAACVRSGCSGTLCVEPGQERMTTCEYSEKYACYDAARCEKQPDGKCGWTKSATLDACLAAGGPAQVK